MTAYALAADLMLALHVALVAFVVTVPLLVLPGWHLGWRWTRRAGLRLLHLLLLGVVVLEAWLGWLCPLTAWEMQLRARAGGASYRGDFVAHWLGELLYVSAPPWVFTLVYSGFLVAVVAINLCCPPDRGWPWSGLGRDGRARDSAE